MQPAPISDDSGAPARADVPPSGPFPWHTLPPAAVAERLGCGLGGLSQAEAARRLERYGRNELPEVPPVPPWRIFVRQFVSPLIYILLVAAAVSLALGLMDDAVFIMGVLLINAVIGYVQEAKAEQDIRSLGSLLVARARVNREGHLREVDSALLVPGDLVWLESGVRVAADARLLEARGLRVDESLLTGESMPVEKAPAEALPEETPPSDRRNMVFSGTTVFQGRGAGLVVGTGLETQVGLIASELHRQQRVKPPLLIRMERFTRVIALVVLGLSGVIFAMGLLRGDSLGGMLMSALALSVSAIPEGLPVALTVALAIGVNRMARRNVLVRRLEAVEALGSCSVIGSDKTGTLTANQLTVVAGVLGGVPLHVSGAGFLPEGEVQQEGRTVHAEHHPLLLRLARAGALCNESELVSENGELRVTGDPTDAALLVLALKAGVHPEELQQALPRTNAIPFEPERRYAASLHRMNGHGLTVVKGAPERVLPMCRRMWLQDRAEPLPLEAGRIAGDVGRLAEAGYRVLALAEQETPMPVPPDATPEEPADLTLIGLVGMADPPRPGVQEAIEACHRAGVRVMMITGDHLQTGRRIAEEIGLLRAGDDITDGPALDQRTDDEVAAAVGTLGVLGRATPSAKLRVVRALQRGGEFVAVTGDGVNDAPALRAANIGVAMGRAGTDVAREASDLVITDDNFASIVGGVEEGRVAYDNVRKVIYLLVSTGLGEVLSVLLAMFFALPVPFLPAQLLWLNLVTNGVQDVALAFEPKEDDVLSRPPRPPSEGIFNRLMVERTLLACLVFGGVGFGMFAWLLDNGYGLAEARAMMLNLFVAFEIFHLGNSRSEWRSLFRINPFSNRLLFLGTLGAMAVHAAALHWPVTQAVLGAALPSPRELLALIVLASIILAMMEVHKLLRSLLGATR